MSLMNIEELGLVLPPVGGGEPLHCTVSKSYKYISLVFHSAAGSEPTVFTIHQADARRLSEALAEAISTDQSSFEHTLIGRSTEGVYRGGPPRREQLEEFRSQAASGEGEKD
jgi:hypothetical protein